MYITIKYNTRNVNFNTVYYRTQKFKAKKSFSCLHIKKKTHTDENMYNDQMLTMHLSSRFDRFLAVHRKWLRNLIVQLSQKFDRFVQCIFCRMCHQNIF